MFAARWGACCGEGEAVEVVLITTDTALAPATGTALVVELCYSGGTAKDLGVGVDEIDEDLCIIKKISDGMVMSYNKTCPFGKAIKVYDRIISLNGKRGSLTVFNKMLAQWNEQDQNTLTIEVVQPTETRVLIECPGDLGATFNYTQASLGILITEIHYGLLSDWNKAHPDSPIKSGDLIVAVNGVANKAPLLRLFLRRINKSRALDMTFMRYAC
ncbi:unnamed protein product [Polarella glacialis]|uniref:PDZ domain-containing protein n=1 Tax=Polarella glacialis TaxID=89957 RepID=A0A813HLQ6_POLGL|nr:unnamed protein product [Polarella glacialis]CAE8686788.1 unnamed protein product [Polarella glacialis]